jgi:hypothetical protein
VLGELGGVRAFVVHGADSGEHCHRPLGSFHDHSHPDHEAEEHDHPHGADELPAAGELTPPS